MSDICKKYIYNLYYPKLLKKSGSVKWLNICFTILQPPRYNWNIVESGVKHHQTNKPKILEHLL
jgi:hypothetical protein